MTLKNQEVEAYNRDGFLIIENILPQETIEEIKRCISLLKENSKNFEFSQDGINLEAPGGGFYSQTGSVKSHKGIIRAIFHLEKKDPFFASLSKCDALYTEVAQVLLKNKAPFLAASNYWGKPARIGSEQPWHQDLPYLGPEERAKYAGALTIWIALDPATKQNGCLEFYPGSHKLGDIPYLGSIRPEDNNQSHIDVDKIFPSIKPVPIELNPGSAVCFNGLVVHGSKKNDSDFDRRAISFAYLYY